jgi:hypothetical protein
MERTEDKQVRGYKWRDRRRVLGGVGVGGGRNKERI